MLDLILFIVCCALYAYGRYRDITSSIKSSWYYGQWETNKLWRDKDGEFAARWNIVASVAVFAGSLAVALFTDHYMNGSPLLILWGAAGWIMANTDDHHARNMREVQIALLRRLHNRDPNGQTVIGDAGDFTYLNNKAFYKLFHWLWVPKTGDLNADQQAVVNRLIETADSPESQWFPR